MKHGILIASFLILALVVTPATAFSAERLQIVVDEEGDAAITFDYTLSWIEKVAVFFKITEPEQELKKALEDALGLPVTVTAAESDVASFFVGDFARIESSGSERVYSTPGLDLTGAQKVLDDYWFAALVESDFSPDLTVVRFPDGYEKTFEDESYIPPLTHAVT